MKNGRSNKSKNSEHSYYKDSGHTGIFLKSRCESFYLSYPGWDSVFVVWKFVCRGAGERLYFVNPYSSGINESY